jgi:acid phosphatase class B
VHAAPPAAAVQGTQVRWITLADLERSLPKEPISVVFDVDDTALFTSAGFQWGTKTYGAHIVSAGVAVREEDLPSTDDKRKYREFWTKMNNELDQYSVKKWIAGELGRAAQATRGPDSFRHQAYLHRQRATYRDPARDVCNA